MIITKRNITFEKFVLVRKWKLHTVRLISRVTKRYRYIINCHCIHAGNIKMRYKFRDELKILDV